MTHDQALTDIWNVTATVAGFLGFVGVLLLGLALLGLIGRW